MTEGNIYDRLEREIYETIAQRFKDSETILEIGCGNCGLANFLAHKTGNRVVGLDIAGTEFAQAKEAAKRLGVSHLVNCIKGNAENLSLLLKQKFQAAVSMWVLHELRKPVKVLRETKKVLKNGAHLITVDFIRGSSAEKMWEEDYYTPEEMESLLEKAGFKDIGIEFFGERELAFVTGQAEKEALRTEGRI